LLFSRQRLRLIGMDLICTAGALWLAPIVYLYVRKGYVNPVHFIFPRGWETIFVICLQLYLIYLCDLYDLEKAASRVFVAAGTAIASASCTLIMMLLYFFLNPLSYGRGAISLFGPFSFLSIVAGRNLLISLYPLRDSRSSVMILSNGQAPKEDVALVLDAVKGRHDFKGIIARGECSGAVEKSIPVSRIKSAGEIRDIVRRNRVRELVLAKGCEKQADLVREVIRLSYEGVVLSDPVTFFERVTGRLPCEHLDDAFLLSCHIGKQKFLYMKLKRLLDILVSSVGIVVTLPLWLAIAVAIKLTSRGPVFFVQERLGLEGKPFKMIKFRTMVEDAEPNGEPVLATKEDPRITPVGRFLRKTRLDELPQLINVLRGDMSLIGPRPERAQLVEEFEKQIPYYRERLAVRPGITGWAQVNFAYANDVESTREKLRYDLYYIKNASLALDLVIVFMTAKKMLRFGGQ